MARQKNVEWNAGEYKTTSQEQARLATLMDIRDELQELNRTLSYYRVREAMDAIRRVDRRLALRLSLRPKAKR